MAVLNSTANSVQELFRELAQFLINPANFSAGNAWQLMRPGVVDSTTTEVILKGVGDGEDEIYVGMKIKNISDSQQNILLNGFCGYDPHLEWYEQPGSIYKDVLPCIPLAKDVAMTYWFTANTSRFTVTVMMSNQYESAYVGFMKPVAIERQYPYPLVIGGSAQDGITWSDHSANHSAYFDPKAGSGGYSALCVRRPDGVWKYGGNDKSTGRGSYLQTWPNNTSPVDTFTVYVKDEQIPQPEDHMLFPILIYEPSPTGILGQLDGVYWIGNRADLAARDNVIYNGVTYKVFNNVYNRDDDAYHVIEWR